MTQRSGEVKNRMLRPGSNRDALRRAQPKGLLVALLLAAFATFPGCGGGGASSGILPPPPATITVVATPPSANVLLGKTLQLTATVSGSSNNPVSLRPHPRNFFHSTPQHSTAACRR